MSSGVVNRLVTCALASAGCATGMDGGSGGATAGGAEQSSVASSSESSSVASSSASGSTSAGSGGASATSTTGSGGCTGGQASCSGACVDLTTDPENCGYCGKDCMKNPCVTGICQAYEVISTGQDNARGIALDATFIYWTTEAGNTVMKMPKAGGNPVTLASNQNDPYAIAVDANNVYWTNGGDSLVSQVSTAGGAPIVLGTDGSSGIAVDAGSVYWASVFGKIMKAPVGGGTPASIADAPYAQRLAVQGSWVYFTATEPVKPVTVYRVPTTGGVPVKLATSTGPAFVPLIAVDATSVYWADGDAILSAPLAGAPKATTLATGFGVWQVAVDATSVYWAENGGNIVHQAPAGGGGAVTLATVPAAPATEIAVDATSIYWTSYGASAIVKAPR